MGIIITNEADGFRKAENCPGSNIPYPVLSPVKCGGRSNRRKCGGVMVSDGQWWSVMAAHQSWQTVNPAAREKRAWERAMIDWSVVSVVECGSSDESLPDSWFSSPLHDSVLATVPSGIFANWITIVCICPCVRCGWWVENWKHSNVIFSSAIKD